MTNYVERSDIQYFRDLAKKANVPVNESNAEHLYNRLLESGFSEDRAKVITAHSIVESGVDPTRKQDGGGPGYGLIQWEGDRKNNMMRFKSNATNELDRQIDYLIHELQSENSWHHGGRGSGYAKAIEAQNTFNNSDNITDLIHSTTHGFIRNKDRQERIDQLTEILT